MDREVGTLWIGGSLSWMEQLCLKSYVDQGQKITLFSYEDIPNVPEGVIRRDGREIIDTDDFIKYEKKDSYALFADLFRLHMIARNPGMIWIDTDVYCLQPMTYTTDYVMGYELPDTKRVNNAVLGLPHDSIMLRQMLAFTSERFSIAPFLKAAMRREYYYEALQGRPVHVSKQPWGVWGPMMVTYFARKLKVQDLVQPVDAFYPITFRERTLFLRPTEIVEEKLTENTTALHLWASNKKELGNWHDGIPPQGSYLDMLLKKHDIKASAAPIKTRGRNVFDTQLLDEIEIDKVDVFCDITGQSQALAAMAHFKWKCAIQLIALDDKGKINPDKVDWTDEYRSFLIGQGVPEEKILFVTRPKDVQPAGLTANLNGFGATKKVNGLANILPKLFAQGGSMIMDIKKGSGAFPFLRDYGTNSPIAKNIGGDKNITRVLVKSHPPPPSWREIANDLAGESGFYREGNEHNFLFVKRSDTLVVTFDNLDIAMNKREERRPWGFDFIEKQGWSMLGVMADGWTWYRDPWVWEQFDDLRDSGFYKQFQRVVFYGASMGGYAAAAFSPSCPGSDVVAISPQSTLDKSLVPWETRYKTAWDRDYSGPYGDAAAVSSAAHKVTIIFDPFEPLDSGHVARFTGDNVMALRAPMMGHRVGSSLKQMGILSPIILGALDGSLMPLDFHRMLRARKEFGRYHKELFDRCLARNRPGLARKLGSYVLDKGDNRYIRRKMQDL